MILPIIAFENAGLAVTCCSLSCLSSGKFLCSGGFVRSLGTCLSHATTEFEALSKCPVALKFVRPLLRPELLWLEMGLLAHSGRPVTSLISILR